MTITNNANNYLYHPSKKIGVMIPTYNEAGNIEPLVRQILALGKNIWIVVVDDNSQDGTENILDSLAQEFLQLKIIHRLTERGRASAGIRGFKELLALKVDLMIEMDADFSHDPQSIPQLVQYADQYDIVIGSRYIQGGRTENCSFLRNFASIFINRINGLLFGLKVVDSSGGFKCYQNTVMATIDWDHFISQAYTVGLEILVRANSHGFSMKEVPICFKNRVQGKSKANWKVAINYPLTLLQLKFFLK